MGSHWQALGFASAEAMAACARATVPGQLRLVARFLKVGRLDAMLAAGDMADFARRYNGPAFRQNRYDTKIAAAWAEAVSALAARTPSHAGATADGAISQAASARPFAAESSPNGVR